MTCAFGIDLGGTKMDIGLVDMSGQVKDHILVKTKAKEGKQAIIQDIVTGIDALRKRNEKAQPVALGIGMAGQIEKGKGVVHFAPNLPGWQEIPLKMELESALKLPVFVTNDVRAATWGEWLFGAGRGCDDLICIFVGTGIGGGIVSGGKMLEGFSNTAGEIGHMTLDLIGPLCTCGNRGCFEAHASGWAIGKSMREEMAKAPDFERALLEAGGGKKDELSARHLFLLKRKGHPSAEKIIAHVSEALIAGVANLINAFNPQRINLGGGIINGYPEFVEIIRKGVLRRALKAPLKSLEIMRSALHADAGVIGAAAYAAKSAKELSDGEQ